MKYYGKTNEYFEIVEITDKNQEILQQSKKDELSLLWFGEGEHQLTVDAVRHTFHKNQIVCLNEFHNLEINRIGTLQLLRFNKPFYCILDHDQEIGCKGVLYFGSSNLPILNLSDKDIEILGAVWKMIYLEMEAKDGLQLEMLQTMLKRVLILCTRIYKSQESYQELDSQQVNIFREFNFLVDVHFREKHTVAEYAEVLNKSPKTVSNLFKKLDKKSPLQYIQERRMLEARRLLRYTEKSISEIGYEIGFNDIQSFSRFFKKHEATSPSDFRDYK